jgi:hypothetical protein
MRATESNGLMFRKSLMGSTRALRRSAVALGIGLLLASGAARAQQKGADEDEPTFEEKIIEGIMKGIGGTNMENTGIDYRERSPLVVPRKLDLPPPASTSAEVKAPNWPKDPDEARRKAAIAARKKENKDPVAAARVLSPSELNVGKPTGKSDVRGSDSTQPGGDTSHNTLSPSQLGYSGGFMGMFKGNSSESAQFKGEPTRDSLTQPPSGYQTPSPNYAYGTGPQQPLNSTHFDIMSGKEK